MFFPRLDRLNATKANPTYNYSASALEGSSPTLLYLYCRTQTGSYKYRHIMDNFCRNISHIGKGRNNEQTRDPIGLHDPDPPGKFLQWDHFSRTPYPPTTLVWGKVMRSRNRMRALLERHTPLVRYYVLLTSFPFRKMFLFSLQYKTKSGLSQISKPTLQHCRTRGKKKRVELTVEAGESWRRHIHAAFRARGPSGIRLCSWPITILKYTCNFL